MAALTGTKRIKNGTDFQEGGVLAGENSSNKQDLADKEYREERGSGWIGTAEIRCGVSTRAKWDTLYRKGSIAIQKYKGSEKEKREVEKNKEGPRQAHS